MQSKLYFVQTNLFTFSNIPGGVKNVKNVTRHPQTTLAPKMLMGKSNYVPYFQTQFDSKNATNFGTKVDSKFYA